MNIYCAKLPIYLRQSFLTTIRMKNLFLRLVTLFCIAFMSSCSPVYYYQLVNTTPGENLKENGDSVIYEDNNCLITYNLWRRGGATLIKFQNKTDEDIYLDLASCFYFVNGQAIDLYNGSTTSNSVSDVQTVGLFGVGFPLFGMVGMGQERSIGTNSTVVTPQSRVVIIPAKLYKVIGETKVPIQNQIYRDCNLFLAPNKKNISSSSFSMEESPINFGLRLCYYVGKSEEPIMVKNEFYVNKITNYPSKSFFENYIDKNSVCPDENVMGIERTRFFFYSPSAYYLRYNPTNAMREGQVYPSPGRKH